MSKELKPAMLSTIDNPFNPFDNFDEWFAYDIAKGHNCCGLLSRFAFTSDLLSDYENAVEIDRAIDEIINVDASLSYIKVIKSSKTNS